MISAGVKDFCALNERFGIKRLMEPHAHLLETFIIPNL